MFEVVVAARPVNRVWKRPDTLAGSVVAHAAMVGLVALAAGRAPSAPLDLEQEMATFLEVLSTPPVPSMPVMPGAEGAGVAASALTAEGRTGTAAPALPSNAALDRVSLELPTLDAPIGGLGELDLVAMEEFGAVEGALGLGAPGVGAEDDPDAANSKGGPAVLAAALAERPRVINRYEMEELWEKLYPPLLNMKGIGGDAVVSFVISTDGRVEPETIRMVSSTHPEFIVATIAGIKRLRFAPARLNGSPVRVRAVMPVYWRPQEG